MRLLANIWNLLALVLFLIGIGWILREWYRRTENQGMLVFRWIATAVLVTMLIGFAATARDEITKIVAIFAAVAVGGMLAILWVPVLVGYVGNKFASLLTGGEEPPEPRPFYSIAEGKRKMGHYTEALAEIHAQLQKFPEDFQGWMMLAEIQAEDLKDFITAQDTIERLLSQPDHAPKNVAFALNRLADWHLKLAKDRDSAAAALRRIIETYPDSEMAQLATQRIAHLTSDEMLQQKTEPRRLALPEREVYIGLRDDFEDLKRSETDPARAASEYVNHLQDHPLDHEIREKLAHLYAEHYQRIDLAVDQLEQLISVPNQPVKDVVHWLNVMADFYLKGSGDLQAARRTLQRIVDSYPKSAWAENALVRMSYLKLELKQREAPHVVKLGTYEQNIGLKGSSPE
jgi:outer membrane protein assembly factor BamD (BamD/ComL family)